MYSRAAVFFTMLFKMSEIILNKRDIEGLRQKRGNHGMTLAYTIGQMVEIDCFDGQEDVLVINCGRAVTTDSRDMAVVPLRRVESYKIHMKKRVET